MQRNLKIMTENVKKELKAELNSTIYDLTKSTEKAIEKLEVVQKKTYMFWDFENIKKVFFWSLMIFLMLFLGKETLEVYEVEVPKILYKIIYPVMFLPVVISSVMLGFKRLTKSKTGY